MGVRQTAAQMARRDYEEERERYGLFATWEEELIEREREMDRFWEKNDWRVFETWGV